MITPTPRQAAWNRWTAQVSQLERQIRDGTAHKLAIRDLREAERTGVTAAVAICRFRVALFAPLPPMANTQPADRGTLDP